MRRHSFRTKPDDHQGYLDSGDVHCDDKLQSEDEGVKNIETWLLREQLITAEVWS